MKYIFRVASAIVIVFLLTYLTFSVLLKEIDYHKWDLETRKIWLVAACVYSLIGSVFSLTIKTKQPIKP